MIGVKDLAALPEAASTTAKPQPQKDVPVSNSLVMVADPNGPQAEAIRALRTHLLAQHVQLGRRALAVCSANAGVGKTFIAANLAVSFAQIGVKVVLVDANVRDPQLQTYFLKVDDSVSLQNYIQNELVTFGEAISSDTRPNLSMIFAGTGSASSQDLLGGERFKHLIEFCLRDYDLTIVDTPAANSSTDARRVSALVSYSLIVAGKNSTRLSDVHVLLDQITGDHGTAIGTVLNNA